MNSFKNIKRAIEEIKLGKMVVVTDNDNRENEGDLIMAGELVQDSDINFMATYGKGLICTPISQDYATRLGLPLMTSERDKQGTAFTISCDLLEGTTTGISAYDRALTARALANPSSVKSDFNRPGHMFPLIAKTGGVLVREGHTEAAVDLAKLAGLTPCGVICEIVNDNGTMARGRDLKEFCSRHNLLHITIDELKKYMEFLFENSPIKLPTKYGEFKIEVIENCFNPDMPHLLISSGKLTGTINLRVHSECFTGDLLGSLKCDCGDQLNHSLQFIKDHGGAVLYLRQEGRGIGLINKLRAYHLQSLGFDTLDANLALGFKDDERDYTIVGDVLKERNINAVHLLTNNPLKVDGLKKCGIEVASRIPLIEEVCEHNRGYLETKKRRMGHMLNLEELV